jgi:prepilin-type N-terminal cleavage/methylation domain-containing protein
MSDARDHDARDQDGFTLIELLIVIVILGILATVVVFAVRGITDQGTESSAAADESTLVTAEEAYLAVHGSYAPEPNLVSAGLLRAESTLHDIDVAADGSSYTVGATGSFSPAPAPAPAPAPTPGPVTYGGTYAGEAAGAGSKTLVIIGDGIGSSGVWAALVADLPPDTTAVWLNSGDVGSTADVDAIVASAPTYIVAASNVAISNSSGGGSTFVGSYMDSKWPGTFWWSFRDGNPSPAQLAAILA